MRPQSGKAKGRRLQQAVASALCQAFGLAHDDVRSTSMGASGEDVQLSTRARACVPYSFECKNQERLNLWASLEQASSNTPQGCTPVLVVKRNGVNAHAVLPFEHFVDLISGRSGSERNEHGRRAAIEAMEAAIDLLRGQEPVE